MKSILAIVLAATFVASVFSSGIYYTQCDSRWQEERIGGGAYTTCQEGNQLTTLANMLSRMGVRCSTFSCNPSDLNKWLSSHDGFTHNHQNVKREMLDQLNVTYHGGANRSECARLLDQRYGVVGFYNRWVLIEKDFGNGSYLVHDSLRGQILAPASLMFDKIEYYENKNKVQGGSSNYTMCDPQWANETLGKSNLTICKWGFMMTGISNMLTRMNIACNNSTGTCNPTDLNKWLLNNNKFKPSSESFEFADIAQLGAIHQVTGKDSPVNYLNRNYTVVARQTQTGHKYYKFYVIEAAFTNGTVKMYDPQDGSSRYYDRPSVNDYVSFVKKQQSRLLTTVFGKLRDFLRQ